MPAGAARPLPDSGKWDRTFALYARDVAQPWKRVTVRLDTYSGAPVDFAAYEVDPADVLVRPAVVRGPAGPVLVELPSLVDNIASTSTGRINRSAGVVTLAPATPKCPKKSL